VEKVVKNAQKKVASKTSLKNMNKNEKSAFFRHVFANNFFWCIFSKLFQQIRNQRRILRFLTPFLIFSKKKFFKGHTVFVLFSYFDCKCAGNGPKKRKIFFYKCVLEFILHPSKGLFDSHTF
jgi:hypothetical protein